MKKNCTYILVTLLTLTLATVAAASAFADGSAGIKTVEGVMAIKEGHGEFLIRLSDGSAQRFSVRGDAPEITRNGEPVSYSELKVSDNIQVKYNAANRKVIEIRASGS